MITLVKRKMQGPPGDNLCSEPRRRITLEWERPCKGGSKREQAMAEEERLPGTVRRETEKTESEEEGLSPTGRHESTEH